MYRIRYMYAWGLLAGIVALGAGCAKKGRTISVEPASGRIVETAPPSELPVFVTERPRTETETPLDSGSEPIENYLETITPVIFSPKETEHVRITDYDPFCGESELVIDLDELKRHFRYPYSGSRISNYGMRGRAMHTGVDIKAVPNDTVRAVLGGVVRMSKSYAAYGNIVVIRHTCGLETAYAHNSKNLVNPNDVVRAGDPIALAGRTGRATTEHLHFETRIAGEHFDPNLILDTQNQALRSGKLTLKRNNGRITAYCSGYAPESDAQAMPSRQSAVASNSIPTQVPEIHSVQRGDTLYSISRRYGLTVDQLCALNGISQGGVLSIGQKLKLK